MKVPPPSSDPIGIAKRALTVAGAFLLATTATTVSMPPATAGIDLFSTPRAKQARGRVPGRRRGGARRGPCPDTDTQLTALVAAVEIETQTLPETYVGGITTAEHPTFWFDVPYRLNDEATAEFVLQDDSGQDIYRTTSAEFATANQTPGATTPGIIGISLPEALEPLTVGQTYQWYFKVDCGAESPLYVRGGIERVALEPALANQLSIILPLEQVALYQANEIWYDAVSAITPLYLAQKDNPTVSAAWTELMRSLGLEHLEHIDIVSSS